MKCLTGDKVSVYTKNAVALNDLTEIYVMTLYIIKNLYKNYTEHNFVRLLLDKPSLRFHVRFVSLQKPNQASYPHLIFSYFGCEMFNEGQSFSLH